MKTNHPLIRERQIPAISIKPGQKVRFDPTHYMTGFGISDYRCKVTGTVVMVNHDHRWFSVQYGKLRTSFMFSQIGEDVKIL